MTEGIVNVEQTIETKIEKVKTGLKKLNKVLVAFSGGKTPFLC